MAAGEIMPGMGGEINVTGQPGPVSTQQLWNKKLQDDQLATQQSMQGAELRQRANEHREALEQSSRMGARQLGLQEAQFQHTKKQDEWDRELRNRTESRAMELQRIAVEHDALDRQARQAEATGNVEEGERIKMKVAELEARRQKAVEAVTLAGTLTSTIAQAQKSITDRKGASLLDLFQNQLTNATQLSDTYREAVKKSLGRYLSGATKFERQDRDSWGYSYQKEDQDVKNKLAMQERYGDFLQATFVDTGLDPHLSPEMRQKLKTVGELLGSAHAKGRYFSQEDVEGSLRQVIGEFNEMAKRNLEANPGSLVDEQTLPGLLHMVYEGLGDPGMAVTGTAGAAIAQGAAAGATVSPGIEDVRKLAMGQDAVELRRVLGSLKDEQGNLLVKVPGTPGVDMPSPWNAKLAAGMYGEGNPTNRAFSRLLRELEGSPNPFYLMKKYTEGAKGVGGMDEDLVEALGGGGFMGKIPPKVLKMLQDRVQENFDNLSAIVTGKGLDLNDLLANPDFDPFKNEREMQAQLDAIKAEMMALTDPAYGARTQRRVGAEVGKEQEGQRRDLDRRTLEVLGRGVPRME